MTPKVNVLKVGGTGTGKTLSGVFDVMTSPDEAAVVLDPHKQSLAEGVVTYAGGNLLFDRLSDIRATLGYELLAPSGHPDLLQRQLENQRRAEAFVAVLLRRRNADSAAATPLLEEWVLAAIALYLAQAARKPLPLLPFAFLPGTDEFRWLLRDCADSATRHKFAQLEKLSPRALRAEVGSAARLVDSVFRSPAFAARARGGFDLGAFLQARGTLVVERGEDVGDDTMRAVMGAIVLLVVDHAKRRPRPHPPIRVYIDEATNARLVGGPELRGLAETRKNGLFWTLLVQNLDFPDGPDAVLQNCHRHEWFGCPFHELARKAATDVAAGLPPTAEESRAERVARLTDEITTLPPGWRYVRDPAGARKEYVPLLPHPWPDWPGLRAAKLEEKLTWIRARPEYGAPATPPCSPSSAPAPRPPSTSPPSSPAARWRRGGGRPASGPPGSGGAGGCA